MCKIILPGMEKRFSSHVYFSRCNVNTSNMLTNLLHTRVNFGPPSTEAKAWFWTYPLGLLPFHSRCTRCTLHPRCHQQTFTHAVLLVTFATSRVFCIPAVVCGETVSRPSSWIQRQRDRYSGTSRGTATFWRPSAASDRRLLWFQVVAPFGVSTRMAKFQPTNMVTLLPEDFVQHSLLYLGAGDKTYGSVCHSIMVREWFTGYSHVIP